MTKQEVIDKWQLLLDNYELLNVLFGNTIKTIAPDKELLTETIKLLHGEQKHE